MTTATLNISQVLTVITSNCVYTTKLSNLVIEANKFNQVNINGLAKVEKLNKYLGVLNANGYSVICENWNQPSEILEGINNFSIELCKNK
jgi:hypothetical protein